MALRFLDANIIIRHITKDNEVLSKKAYQILKRIEAGTLTATMCESILTECVFVLSSRNLYDLPREKIKTALDLILSLRGLKLPHKKTYRRALEIYASTNLDFPDALAVAHMERLGLTEILSFDEDFDTLTGITRRTG